MALHFCRNEEMKKWRRNWWENLEMYQFNSHNFLCKVWLCCSMKKRCTTFFKSNSIDDDVISIINHQKSISNNIEIKDSSSQEYERRVIRKSRSRLSISIKRATSDDLSDSKRALKDFCQRELSWHNYKRFIEKDSSDTYLAYEWSSTFSIVMIKKHVASKLKSSSNILKTSHTNLVNLRNVYVNKDMTFFIYEHMQVSFEQIYSVVNLKKSHIITVCKEIVLSFLFCIFINWLS